MYAAYICCVVHVSHVHRSFIYCTLHAPLIYTDGFGLMCVCLCVTDEEVVKQGRLLPSDGRTEEAKPIKLYKHMHELTLLVFRSTCGQSKVRVIFYSYLILKKMNERIIDS